MTQVLVKQNIEIKRTMNIRDIDLNLLHIFNAIYSMRSISRAADHLDLSQPGMSHALGRLRKQLDDPLFVRKGNGVEPTARANEISEPIRLAIEQLSSSLEQNTSFNPTKSKRHFRLMIVEFTEQIILPHLLSKLEQNSNITFELVPIASIKMEDALLDGLIDVAVMLQPDARLEIQFESLFSINPVLIFKNDHPIRKELPNPAALQNYGTVAINLRSGRIQNLNKVQLLEHPSELPNCLVSSVIAIPPIVEKSDHIGFIPALHVPAAKRQFAIDSYEMPFKVVDQDIFLIWHVRSDEEPAQTWLRTEIRNSIREYKQANMSD